MSERFDDFEIDVMNAFSHVAEWCSRYTFRLQDDRLAVSWRCSGLGGSYSNEWIIDSNEESAWRDALDFVACLTDPENINIEGLERLEINGWKNWRSELVALALLREDDTSLFGEDLLRLTEAQCELLYREFGKFIVTEKATGAL